MSLLLHISVYPQIRRRNRGFHHGRRVVLLLLDHRRHVPVHPAASIPPKPAAPISTRNYFRNSCAFSSEHRCLKNGSPAQRLQTPPPPPTVPEDTWGECSLCFEDVGDYVLFPCGHAGMCKKCAEQLTRCSQCRKDVTGRTKIYRS